MATKARKPSEVITETIPETRWYDVEDDISGIGSVIVFEREQAKLSRLEVCSGLCSKRFLGQLEREERGCEKLLANAILERIGVAADRFFVFYRFQRASVPCGAGDSGRTLGRSRV